MRLIFLEDVLSIPTSKVDRAVEAQRHRPPAGLQRLVLELATPVIAVGIFELPSYCVQYLSALCQSLLGFDRNTTISRSREHFCKYAQSECMNQPTSILAVQ